MDTKMNSSELLDLQANNSIAFEENGTPKQQVTRQDGSKTTYDENYLRAYLQKHVDAIDNELIDIDIICKKVSEGIYNGKSTPFSKLVSSNSKLPNTRLFQILSIC